ncbi:TIGR02270 family protein [Variovorax paradoxus]|nr:TIGR02270 family protein [Variovorax paradoxus]MBT2303333.1 TIGR02270 family protein [Variovorax paradoxus]
MKPSHVSAGTVQHVPLVVARHVEEAALLCNQRLYLVQAPHAKLHHLRRLDDRLAAHLDGLLVAGHVGGRLAQAALANTGCGEMFTAVALAFDSRDTGQLDRILAIAELLTDVQEAVVLAVGWVSAQSLRGINRDMLASPVAFHRRVAIAACAFHMVDPGDFLAPALDDADAALRAQALRAAGDCGRRDLVHSCNGALNDADASCRFWAARSAVLLGERHAPIHPLHEATHLPGPQRAEAFSLLFKLATSAQAAPLLKAMLERPESVRDAIRGAGTVGDPQVVPWLIQQMHDLKLTRLAGESFSLITGLDVAHLDLDRKPPENVELGPNDDPNDDSVAMDEDDGLPWPDPEKIGAWWRSNSHRFAAGARYFMGEPPSPAHCLSVLKTGFQRQRKAAAVHLCLMNPGTPLFNTAAPAWRQQRWLDAMGA